MNKYGTKENFQYTLKTCIKFALWLRTLLKFLFLSFICKLVSSSPLRLCL